MKVQFIILTALTIAGVIGAMPVTGNVPLIGTVDGTAEPSQSIQAPAYVDLARLDRRIDDPVNSYWSLPQCDYEHDGMPFCVYPIKLSGTWCGTPHFQWSSELDEALETGQPPDVIWRLLERAPSSPQSTLVWGHPW